jgi:GntR family transcriptional regulator, transcriptional repressor for pyruvate dehydrogenase complex
MTMDDDTASVRPQSRGGVQDVTDRLLRMLTEGVLEPGQRLPAERKLAEDLGVGRATVREALATLETLGVVETRQGAGSYLKGNAENLLPQSIEWGLLLNRPETLDLAEARAHLEIVTVQLATERATPEDLEALQAAQQRMVDAVGDATAFVDADVAFHLEIARIARNSVLAGMLSGIRSLLEVWIRRASRGEASTNRTLREHRRIVDAITTGNRDLATGAMQVHMDAASNRLHESLNDDAKGAQAN